MHFQKAPATVDAIANAVSSVAARLPPRRCILRHGATAAGRSPPPLRCSVGPLVQQRDRQLSGGPWTLHAHEEVGRLSPLEAVVGELLAYPLYLVALLRRTEVRVELPHRPPHEAVRRAQPRAAALGHRQPPHAGDMAI